MGSTGGRIPDWIRFTQNPDQFVSARCYAKTSWWMRDVNTPEKRIDLPAPNYMVRRLGSSFGFGRSAPTKENVYATQMRLSQNRTQIAMRLSESYSRSFPQKRQISFWSFPEMEKKGTLDIDRLSGGKNNASWGTDLVFSRWSDSRIWVWRNAPRSSMNLWWEGVERNRHQNEGAVSTPPRLELRDKPAYSRAAMGKGALAKWVVQLGSDEYKTREKASAVLESIHDDDVPLLAKFNPPDPEVKVRLLEIRKVLHRREVGYRLRAAIDLPITVELLAEHPDGRHVLIYGQGKFVTGKVGEKPKWGRGFVWLRFDPKKSNEKLPTGALQIVNKFQLPLLARSMRFARDGELLIGTAAGTVEIFSSIQPR